MSFNIIHVANEYQEIHPYSAVSWSSRICIATQYIPPLGSVRIIQHLLREATVSVNITINLSHPGQACNTPLIATVA